MRIGEAFESMFGFQSGVTVKFAHKMDVAEVGEVVDEDSSALNAFTGKVARTLRNQAKLPRDYLVDGNTRARFVFIRMSNGGV